jgi:hypothetical protein
MSFRAQAAAVAATAVAALSLAAPTAPASTHGPVQVTGKQLKSALIPASGFLPGYYTISATHRAARSPSWCTPGTRSASAVTTPCCSSTT